MPAIDYRLKDKTRISGVTTIINANLAWNKQALMYWAWDQGRNGKDYKKVAEEAATIGTIGHAMIEADLKGFVFDSSKYPKELVDKAETSFLAWLEWKDLVQFQLLESEKSLVSEKYKFGGTIDIAAIKKKTSIVDLKTSNDVYPDHRIQVAAYGKLFEENQKERIEAYYILQLGKEDGSFHYHYWPSLENEWQAFLCLLKLHELKKLIK